MTDSLDLSEWSLGSTDQIYDSVDRIIESFNFHPSIKNNRRNYKITSKFSFKPVSKEFVKGIGQKKILFSEMQVMRNIFTQA